MAAQLNIKDKVLIERVRILARTNSESVTATLRALVDREWERREADVSVRRAQLDALIAQVQAEMPEEVRSMTSAEIMESIYDDSEPDGFAR